MHRKGSGKSIGKAALDNMARLVGRTISGGTAETTARARSTHTHKLSSTFRCLDYSIVPPGLSSIRKGSIKVKVRLWWYLGGWPTVHGQHNQS